MLWCMKTVHRKRESPPSRNSRAAPAGYDDLGRRTGVTRANGVSTSYAYDAMSNLSTQNLTFPSSGNNLSLGFTYNPAGQIATATRSNDGYAWTGAVNVNRAYWVNSLNQYTSAGSTAFGYDGRGNLTTSGSTTYAYSSDNLLLSASTGAALTYDPAGRLLQVTGAGGTTRFGYDGGTKRAQARRASGE